MDSININSIADTALMATASVGKVISVDGGMEGAMMDPALNTGAQAKDSLLASWPFVAGISAGVLVVSIVLGALLAKRKIKKGIDLYED